MAQKGEGSQRELRSEQVATVDTGAVMSPVTSQDYSVRVARELGCLASHSWVEACSQEAVNSLEI